MVQPGIDAFENDFDIRNDLDKTRVVIISFAQFLLKAFLFT